MAKSKESLSAVARQLVDGIEANEDLHLIGEKVARKAADLIVDSDQDLSKSLNYIRDSLLDASQYFADNMQYSSAIKVVIISKAIYATFEVAIPILATARYIIGLTKESDSEAKERAKKASDAILAKFLKDPNG